MIGSCFDSFIAKIRAACVILVMLVVGGPSLAMASNWRVAPIKISFDVKTRSEVVTVTNESDQPLTLEITAMEWTQGEDGKDLYQPATDLIFFPKQLVIEAKKERVIRTGIKVPAVTKEKAYRLFIREVPGPRQSGESAVAIAIQFGVPIFVIPPKGEVKGEIAAVTMEKGRVNVTARNLGNSHFRVSRVKLQAKNSGGEALDSVETPGWYLLAGSQRTFTIDIPAALCQRADLLEIAVEADRITLSGSTHVDKALCTVP